MNILRVISSVNPTGGGPVEAIRQTSRVLSQLGHSTEVACLDPPTASWLKEFPLQVHALGPGQLKYQYSPHLVPWIKQNAQAYDCIIIDGLWQYSSFGTWLASRHTETPYFVYPHGMLDPWFKRTYPLKHLKKWLYWPWTEYRVLRDAKAVLFTSEEERISARESFWLYHCNEEVVVGLGTFAPPSDVAHQRQLFLNQFPGLQRKKCLLFLGRIHPKKGCDLLIEAFAQIATLDKSLHLIMAGPDQVGLQKKLQERAVQLGISHCITWTGMLKEPLKWGAFYTAEAFVLPSHQENFGVAVVEAMACGVPVLISNKVNIWREIVIDGAGLVANDDLQGFITIFQQWLSLTSEERVSMGKKARQSFTQRFDIEHTVRYLLRILKA